MTMKVIRFNGEAYISSTDVEHWLADTALQFTDPEMGSHGILIAATIRTMKERLHDSVSRVFKKEDDVMLRPGKVLNK
jgi:hypothetical protein